MWWQLQGHMLIETKINMYDEIEDTYPEGYIADVV